MTSVSTGVAVHRRLVRQTYKQGLSALVMTLPSSGFSKPGGRYDWEVGINKMITKGKMFRPFIQFSQLIPQGNA